MHLAVLILRLSDLNHIFIFSLRFVRLLLDFHELLLLESILAQAVSGSINCLLCRVSYMLHLMWHKIQLHGLGLILRFGVLHLESGLNTLKGPRLREALPSTRLKLLLRLAMCLALLVWAVHFDPGLIYILFFRFQSIKMRLYRDSTHLSEYVTDCIGFEIEIRLALDRLKM